VLALVILVDLLGEFRLVPPPVLRISPFLATLEPLRAAGPAQLAPVLAILLVLAAALTGFGLFGLRHRDLT